MLYYFFKRKINIALKNSQMTSFKFDFKKFAKYLFLKYLQVD